MCYLETSPIVLVETSPRVQGTYIERQLQLLKRFPYIFAMFHGRYGVTKTS